jgi:hypothetical protein
MILLRRAQPIVIRTCETRQAHPVTSTCPPWERAPAGARRVKTALTLGTTSTKREQRS